MWGLSRHAGKPNAKCAALLNTRVRITEGVYKGCVGEVKTVCPDKLGDPYQVHVMLDGDGTITIFDPSEIEPELVN